MFLAALLKIPEQSSKCQSYIQTNSWAKDITLLTVNLLTRVEPSSNWSISLMVGSQTTAGKSLLPGSTWNLLATSLPFTEKARIPVDVSMVQPISKPGEERLDETSWLPLPPYLCCRSPALTM